MHFLRGIRRQTSTKKDKTTQCRISSISLRRRLLLSDKKSKMSQQQQQQQHCGLDLSPRHHGSFSSEASSSDSENSENYHLYVSGTFDLNTAAHGSLSADSPRQEEGLLEDINYWDSSKNLAVQQHNVIQPAYSIHRVPPMVNNVVLVQEPLSVARGMRSLLSVSSEEDGVFEFTPGSHSSSFEDLYRESDDDDSSTLLSSSNHSLSRRGTVYEFDPASLEDSTIYYDIMDSSPNQETHQNINGKHSANITHFQPLLKDDPSIRLDDSRDDDETKRDPDVLDERSITLAPAISPCSISGSPLATSKSDCNTIPLLDDEEKFKEEFQHSPSSCKIRSSHPKRIRQRFRSQVRFMQDKIKHYAHKHEKDKFYTPLLEHHASSTNTFNFDTHELMAPMAKKFKTLDSPSSFISSCSQDHNLPPPPSCKQTTSTFFTNECSTDPSQIGIQRQAYDFTPLVNGIDTNIFPFESSRRIVHTKTIVISNPNQDDGSLKILSPPSIQDNTATNDANEISPSSVVASRNFLYKLGDDEKSNNRGPETRSVATQTTPTHAKFFMTQTTEPRHFPSLIPQEVKPDVLRESSSRTDVSATVERKVNVTTDGQKISDNIMLCVSTSSLHMPASSSDSPNQVVSEYDADQQPKGKTKSESKVLQFWAMAQRRAKTESDVHYNGNVS